MAYATQTIVPVERTKAEIERCLTKYGASSFAYMGQSDRAIIVFEADGRRIKFDMPFPGGDDNKSAQQRRSKWRALLLCIKAKLESVESNIETFEEAFLSHVMMADGKTVGEHAIPAIASSYETSTMQPLLPAPNR